MARKRMIDPQIWDSEQVMSLSSDQFKMYIYLISQADDEGRLKISSKLWGNRVFPFGEINPDRVREMLQKMQSIDLIRIYTNGDVYYLYHPNWHKYQKISHPAPSNLPTPEPSVNTPESSVSTPGSLVKSNLIKFNSVKSNSGEKTPEDSGAFTEKPDVDSTPADDDLLKMTKKKKDQQLAELADLLREKNPDEYKKLLEKHPELIPETIPWEAKDER